MIDGLRSAAYTINYLSTVSRLILSLAVNFQSDVLHDFWSFVQFKKCKKHAWRKSINFSKVSLQLY